MRTLKRNKTNMQQSPTTRAQNAQHMVKWYKNKNKTEFQENQTKCEKDRSVGIHYDLECDYSDGREIDENDVALQHLETPQKRLIRRNLTRKFMDINVGDDIILGRGNCDGTGDKRLWVATVSTNCYFEPHSKWKGYYHRIRLSNIEILPSGSKLKKTVRRGVLTRPTEGWGITGTGTV